jgi:hypothetical protein
MEIEVVKGGYGYNPAFCRKGVESQIQILTDTVNDFNKRPYFSLNPGLDPDSIPSLDPSMALEYLYSGRTKYDLPDGCHENDGLFAVISPFGFKKLLRYPKPDVFNPTMYCESLYFLFRIIGEKMAFINYRNGVLSPQYFIQTERSVDGYSKLSYFQGENKRVSDIWIINSQLGFMRRAEPANTKLFSNEYGLSSVFAGCIKLTHPKLASDTWNYLGVTCIGDKFVFDNSVPTYSSNGSSNDSCDFYSSHSIENRYSKFGNATFFV